MRMMIRFKDIVLLSGSILLFMAQVSSAHASVFADFRNSPAGVSADIEACTDDPDPVRHGNSPVFAGKPVNLLSGAETMVRTDLSVGNSFPIIITRRYDSRSAYDSPVGYGWSINYDRRIYTYPDGSVTLRKECGWKKRFSWSVAGYVNPIGDYGVLVMNGDGGYTYTYKSGDKDMYDALGRLTSRLDVKGNSVVLQYKEVFREPLVGLLPYNLNQNTPLIVAYDYHLWKIEEKDASGSFTGTWVELSYNSTSGRLTSIHDNLGREVRYEFDSTGLGNLTNVSGPGGSALYAYTDSRFIHLLTDVDEGRGNYHNLYDSQKRVQSQTHGTGSIAFSYITSYGKTSFTTTIKDLNGNQMKDINNAYLTPIRTVEFGAQGQVTKVTDGLKNVTIYRVDSQMTTTRAEYWKNTSTYPAQNLVLQAAANYTYDAYGNIKTKTESSDWPATGKTTVYMYAYETHPQEATSATYHKVSQEIVPSVAAPGENKVTNYNYNNANGNLLTRTETGFLDPQMPYTYVSSYEYWPNGKLKTITDPLSHVTYYAYDDATGNLKTVTQAYGTNHALTTTYSDWDGFGNPRIVVDPNGNETRYTHDPTTGKIRSVQAPGDTNATQFFYVPNGCASCGGGANRIDHIIMPEGNRVDYGYDGQGNLNTIRDNSGNTITYTYDSERNRIKTQIKDTNLVLKRTLNYIYDGLNRLQAEKNDSTLMAQYGYDARGNRTSTTVPVNLTTSYQYDPLDRVKSVTQPGAVVTSYGYNTNSSLISVTDANGNITTYIYDDHDRVRQVVSPDTGTTTYLYDAASNMLSKTDAKGVTISYTYDELNRLTMIDFPGDTDTVYTYDACVNGKGRLCTLTDASGSTAYEYTPKGQTAKETKDIYGHIYVTQYTYDQNGNVKTMSYPSGRVITYNYSNDRVTSVRNGAATAASNITYLPFGGMTSITYGNGIASAIGYDTKYRIASITAGTVQKVTYTYDYNDNIKSITNILDATRNKTFTPDSLNRLYSAGSTTWNYDPAGNRTAEIINGSTNTYAYYSGTNKLQSVTGQAARAFSYDSNGNTLHENSRTFDYNQNQRLIRVLDGGTTTGEYVYNGFGQRAKKTANNLTTIFHYSLNGQIIAESNSDGITTAEYVYLNGQPLAKIEGTNTYYYHNDHLATPQKMTGSSGTVVWSADYKPFGEASITVSTITNNLRFPGQYFDAETGLHDNYTRNYSPPLGRYIEKDIIGLAGGMNLYAYVENRPLNRIDPYGLYPGQMPPPPPGYDPSTWRAGQWDNGRWFVESPDGRIYTSHPEDKGHWRHWDGPDDDKWPPNSNKPEKNRKKKLKPNQCATDPSGDAPEWTPPTNNLFMPFMPFNPLGVPEGVPLRIPIRIPIPAW